MSLEISSTFATLPKTERGKPIVINGDPKGKNYLYCNGNSVIIRSIEDPSDVDIYTQHAYQTTVAKYSPSGFYIASADISGKVRIWDTTQKEHILKNEFQPISGAIKDISWTSDSQRICVVGEGRGNFGHVFNAETGTSVGEIMGQSKALNNCDFKPTRPFRLVTASEDTTTAFFEGPPFKFKKTMDDLTRFANCVRYAPDGETFTSAGSDGKAFVYDGKTGDVIRELGSPAHKGGIYAICYSPDSKQILTVSGDKTSKIYNVEDGSLAIDFPMGSALEDMQVGCLWQGDHLLTVSLSGHINYLDKNNPSTPLRVIRGHNKQITAMAKYEDGSKIFTGGSDGKICCWNTATGDAEVFKGKGHSNKVHDMKCVESQLISVALDDTLLMSNTASLTYESSVKLPSQPNQLDAMIGGLRVVACINHVVVLRDANIVFTEKAPYEAACVAIHPGLTEIAVGGKDDESVHIFELSGDTLVSKKVLKHNGAITDVSYSPDGAYFAACDTSRKTRLYRLPDHENVVTSQWTVHTARVNTLAWSPDSSRLVSGSLDCSMGVFNPSTITKYIKKPGAHLQSNITRCLWLDNNRVASAAYDGNVKIWELIE